jgi:hypothetical protein
MANGSPTRSDRSTEEITHTQHTGRTSWR